MLEQWTLDPAITYLNHGTVGAPPRRVLESQQKIRDEIERQPSRYLLRDVGGLVGAPRTEPTRLRRAAAAMAAFIGVRGDDLVFVDNATTGINAVLGSLDLRAGDDLLVTDHAYGAIAIAAAHVARSRGVRLHTIELPYPPPGPSAIVRAIADAITSKTRMLIVDHITAESAIVLPVAEIAARCRSRGVPVLVDGAHAAGTLPLDVAALGVDWYAGNFHKWAYAPRSCGFLWATPARQEGLHPAVVSWGFGKGFVAEFDWVGTRDPSAFLAAPDGVAFMRELGIDAVRAYNHDLAWAGAGLLASRWGTSLGVDQSVIGSMATVPLPENAGSSPEDAWGLRDALLFEDGIEVQLHAWRDRLWVRVSAQVYNEMADVERLAAAVASRL
jgi:isopenicillin-N epimerase